MEHVNQDHCWQLSIELIIWTCAPWTGETGAAAADCRRLSSRAICSFASSPFFRLSSSSCSSLLIANASCSCNSSSPADVGRRDSSPDSRPAPAPPYHTTHCLQPTGTRHPTFKTCPSPTLPRVHSKLKGQNSRTFQGPKIAVFKYQKYR